MSSIRPLVTITILIVVGVFLFTKINQAPDQSAVGISSEVDSALADGVPPLASAGASGNTSSLAPAPLAGAGMEQSTGPQWAGSTDFPSTAPSTVDAVTDPSAVAGSESAGADAGGIPNLPPIPELPPPSLTVSEPAPSAPTAPTTSIEVPANVPTARYPDEPTESITDPAPPVSTATASNPAQPLENAASPTESVLSGAARNAFDDVWPSIQTALAQQELSQAHETLSQWYGNPELSPAQSEHVDTLLSQLAGTVVYSNEHRLEAPYVVRGGDTLESIAKNYQVPWQLLAKINGIPAVNMVEPGQELKVVRGPFAAIIELDKHQLTLSLDGRYAGRFPITVEPGATSRTGQWVLEQKLVSPTTGSVDRVLVLRNESPLVAGESISIASGAVSPSGPTAVAPPAVRLAPQDAEELSDILSVGSRIVIRR